MCIKDSLRPCFPVCLSVYIVWFCVKTLCTIPPHTYSHYSLLVVMHEVGFNLLDYLFNFSCFAIVRRQVVLVVLEGRAHAFQSFVPLFTHASNQTNGKLAFGCGIVVGPKLLPIPLQDHQHILFGFVKDDWGQVGNLIVLPMGRKFDIDYEVFHDLYDFLIKSLCVIGFSCLHKKLSHEEV